MSHYQAPLADMRFLLDEVFAAERLWQKLGLDLTSDLAHAALEECGRLSAEVIAPLLRPGDETGARRQSDGRVLLPDGYRNAWQTLAAGGWIGLSGEVAHGGQGLPKMLAILCEEMLYSGDNSFALYATLTAGAAFLLNEHADDATKALYLPKLYSGEWSGCMCLTEPHAGTDLGLLNTKAEPQDDGSYRLNGSKIFITGGEHDLVDNIVHLVLARLPDAPPGIKGISLFLVPKRLVHSDGSLGKRNGVSCGALEAKMGIKASSTCVINYDDAQGWLIGPAHRGLACMFTMMNYERLSIGIQGLGCAERSYQNAVIYARERVQSRPLSGAVNAEAVADPILHHGDVRRMLLTMRAFTEGGRALAVYLGSCLDQSRYSQDPTARERAQARVELLTPVAKAFFTDTGLEACVLGQQVFGGHGYVREWGQEQLVRDVRIAQIYEGTNGIQAIDLTKRKVAANGGAWVEDLLLEIRDFEREHRRSDLADFFDALSSQADLLSDVTQWLVAEQGRQPEVLSSCAVDYLHLLGYGLYTYLWTRMAVAADSDSDFHQAKRAVGRFYLQRLLPRSQALAVAVQSGQAPVALDADWF